jgi:RHS repeat-associated protein
VPRRQLLGFESFKKYDLQTNRFVQQTYRYYQNLDGNRELFLPHRTIVENISQTATVYTPATELNYPRFYFSKTVERDTSLLNQSVTVSELHTYTTDIEASKGRLYRKTVQVVDLNTSNVLTQSKSRYTYNYTALAPVFNSYQLALPSIVYDTAFVGSNYIASRKQYSFSGSRLQSIQDISPDDGTVSTTYTNYNSLGISRTATISSSGLTSRTTTSNYDNTGRFVTSTTNPKSQTSSATYDPKTGNVLTATDINGLLTTYDYDLFGRHRSVIHPDNTKDSVAYCWYTEAQIPHARYYIQTYSTGIWPSAVYYDQLGREVCRKSLGKFADIRYNHMGQVVQTSLPYSYIVTTDNSKIWHTYTYDTYGRITHEIAPCTDISCSYSARQVQSTDNLKNITTSKTYDAAGRLITATDPGGTISYSYAIATDNGKKRERTQVSTGGFTTTIFTDARGNRIKIVDPDAGTITSVYNAYGELTQQTDANGNITSFTYDQLGRITQKSYSGADDSQTLNYYYDSYSSSSRGRGQLSSIRINNVTSDSYTYDALGRPAQKSRIIDGTTYTQSYTYNASGQLEKLTYPNSFAVKHTYDSYGHLAKITRADNDALIYQASKWDDLGNLTEYSYGNDIHTKLTYNNHGLLTQIKRGNKVLDVTTPYLPRIDLSNIMVMSSSIGTSSAQLPYTVNNDYQELNYSYNTSGLMSQRTNAKNSQTETFTYDNLNRLTGYKINSGAQKTFTYSASGNITTHPDVGSYSYDNSAHPHGVSAVTLNSNSIESSAECAVTYNWFNKAKTISEGSYVLDLYYGSHNQRTKTVLKQGSQFYAILKTKYFVSNFYEKEVTLSGTSGTRHLNYIYGNDGLVAILAQTSATDAGTMYYIHTDHLGSYTLITDQNKNKVDSLWFDPWGNRRQYNSWATADTRTSFLFDRGFTGHEHLDRFKIINMNGRLYDPVIARFFSPDPFVQASDFTQGYNRYSYCLNSPLMYKDPSGEFLITFIVNAIKGAVNGENGWETGGNAIANHFKIIGGLFTTDKNRTGGGQFWEFISRFTWQGIQTGVGHLYAQFANMVGKIDKVEYKAGATAMSGDFWDSGQAVTIGNYIHGTSDLEADYSNSLFQHEYGHYLQSQATGFWYLQSYGLPSAFSHNIQHDYHPVEQDANARALKHFNKHIDGFIDNGGWNFTYNKIIGYDANLPFNHKSNQLALKYAKLQPAWYDWVLLPNILISGLFINNFVLSGSKYNYKKFKQIREAGLFLNDDDFYFE